MRLRRTSNPPLPVGFEYAHRFRIIELIGKGGMGEVYRALDLGLMREVALKRTIITNKRRAHDSVIEARAMAKADHPNVAKLYDVIVEDDATVLVMPLIDGVTLRDRLKDGPLEAKEAREIIVQVARGLLYLHGINVVHRDVKPENVMLTTENGETVVKLIDLGLVKLFADGATLVEAGGKHGWTPGYSSPEQMLEVLGLMGPKVDARTDVYSLAVVAYELFAGTPLWPSLDALATTISEGELKAPDLEEIAEPKLRRLLERGLAPRDERSSMGAFLRALEELEQPEATLNRERSALAVGAAASALTAVVCCGLWLAARGPENKPAEVLQCGPSEDAPREPEVAPTPETDTTEATSGPEDGRDPAVDARATSLVSTARKPAQEQPSNEEARAPLGTVWRARHACVPSAGKMTFRNGPSAQSEAVANARLNDSRALAVYDVRYSKLKRPLWLFIEFERDRFGWAHRNYFSTMTLEGRNYACRCRHGELVCLESINASPQP